MATQVRFGVDLGGVLWPAMGGYITVHRVMRIGALPNVVEWMASLVKCIGAENVFIVSKVGHRGQQTWARVLQQSGFYRETGMLEANVHWVRDRTSPGGKAPVAWQLKLTHFVDDHLDVLRDIGRRFSNHGGQCRACTLCPPRRGMITILRFGSLSSSTHVHSRLPGNIPCTSPVI